MAELKVRVKGDTSNFDKAMRRVNGGISRIASMSKIAAVGAAGMAVAFTAAAVAGAAISLKLIKMGEEAGTAEARLLQVNKSMGLFGDRVGEVTDRLIKQSKATALNVGLDEKVIQLTQAKLATFKELADSADEAGGAFDRATMAAIDMAAAGFGEASMNAVQLGKALNDPIKGITSLSRSGITFTAQEKAKIKTLVESNRMLQAQDMILRAIEKQVGGTAVATANGTDKMKVAFDQMLTEIGRPMAEVFGKFADQIANATPEIIAAIKNLKIGEALTEAIEGDPERIKIMGEAVGELLGKAILVGTKRALGGVGELLIKAAKYSGAGLAVDAVGEAVGVQGGTLNNLSKTAASGNNYAAMSELDSAMRAFTEKIKQSSNYESMHQQAKDYNARGFRADSAQGFSPAMLDLMRRIEKNTSKTANNITS